MPSVLLSLLSKKLGITATGLVLIYLMDREPTSSTPVMGAVIGAISITYIIAQAFVDAHKTNSEKEEEPNEVK